MSLPIRRAACGKIRRSHKHGAEKREQCSSLKQKVLEMKLLFQRNQSKTNQQSGNKQNLKRGYPFAKNEKGKKRGI
jgi:hypothetical protein